MLENVNKFLECAQDSLDNIAKDFNLRKYFNTFTKLEYVDNSIKYLDNNEYTKDVFYVIKNANNYNNTPITIMNYKFRLNYLERRRLVLFPSFMLAIVFLMQRSGGLGKVAKFYFVLSALFCRENFNLRNYKLQ